jgi:uncharacterized membrane protein
MSAKAAVTVLRPREEVERRWRDQQTRPRYIDHIDAAVRFVDAPGDRGTEVHVELQQKDAGNKLGDALRRLRGAMPLAKVKDDLRRFKQLVETGEIPRSEAAPEGESVQRKLHERPAQPLREDELEKVGV